MAYDMSRFRVAASRSAWKASTLNSPDSVSYVARRASHTVLYRVKGQDRQRLTCCQQRQAKHSVRAWHAVGGGRR
jgi:hypothetical protein